MIRFAAHGRRPARLSEDIIARCGRRAPAARRRVSPCRPRGAAPGPHREVHRCGDEAAWWAKTGIDALGVANTLWAQNTPTSPLISRVRVASRRERKLLTTYGGCPFKWLHQVRPPAALRFGLSKRYFNGKAVR
jgi:hypothetical protein